MNNRYKNKILVLILVIMIISCQVFTFADTIVDKRGRDVIEITKPTAESKIYEDSISSAIRHKPDGAKDYTDSKYEGPSKNIYSDNIIMGEEYYDTYIDESIKELYTDKEQEIIKKYGSFTRIRHTASITNVDGDSFEMTNDSQYDRLRLRVKERSVGEFEAKNGFFKIDGKTYYFDKGGLMVLGAAVDSIGNFYFFSYETGELVEEIPVR